MSERTLSPGHLEERWKRATPDVSPEENVVLPSSTWEQLSGKTTEELQAQYPVRYQTYIDVLQGRRKLEDDVPTRRWLGMMNRLDRHIAREHASDSPTLVSEQMDVFQDIRDHFEQGETEGFIVLPTGVGKTVEFVELAEAFDCKTLVVVPTQDLVDQTVDEFKKFAAGLSVGTYWAKSKDLTKQITVTTYDSLLLLIKSGALDPATIDLLILDEAHRALAKERVKVIGRFSSSLKLGVTATDAYAEDKKLQNLLKHEIHRMQIREAIERSLLCDTACAVVHTNVDLSDVPIIDGRYDQEKLEEKYNTPGLNQAAVELYRKQHPGERVVGFCTGVNHALALAKKFRDADISAEAVYGEMDKARRKQLVAAHRRGEIKVLTNAKLLREGVNFPEDSVCLNLAPAGLLDATQRGGRVTRLDRDQPDKLAVIYDFIPLRDPRRPMVLFSEILEGTVVLQKHASDSKGGSSRGPRPLPEADPDIPGIKVTYDADEVMRITQEYKEGKKEITPDDIRAALKEQGVTAKDWVGADYILRGKIRVDGLGIKAIATIFNIEGNPKSENVAFESLCRAVFGDDEVKNALESIQKQKQEKVRQILKEQGVTAKDWVAQGPRERIKIEVNGLKIHAIKGLFGIVGNPLGGGSTFLELCRAIFGSDEVEKIITPEYRMKVIRDILSAKGIAAEDWINIPAQKRKFIDVDGEKLTAIARIFGVEGDPVGNTTTFLELCQAVFGADRLSEAPQKADEKTRAVVREIIEANHIRVYEWLKNRSQEQYIRAINFNGLKLGKLAPVFGINGDPISNTSVFIDLCKAIFGDVEVDRALAQLNQEKEVETKKTQKAIRDTLIFGGITAKDWVVKAKTERNLIEILGIKLIAISRIFGIAGDPIKTIVPFYNLCRAIWSDAEVDQALKELGKL